MELTWIIVLALAAILNSIWKRPVNGTVGLIILTARVLLALACTAAGVLRLIQPLSNETSSTAPVLLALGAWSLMVCFVAGREAFVNQS